VPQRRLSFSGLDPTLYTFILAPNCHNVKAICQCAHECTDSGVDDGPQHVIESSCPETGVTPLNEQHSAWVEINLGAIRHNIQQIRSVIAENTRLMAVVKADAYGHGLVGTARAMVDAGVDALAVTRLDEATALRGAGIESSILVFESIQPDAAASAVALGVELTVCTPELVDALGTAAVSAHKTVKVHLKVDTGMGRLGVLPADAAAMARKIAAVEGVVQAGTYTHFATSSEKDMSPTQHQLLRFKVAVESIKLAFLDPGIVHAANSAAILRLVESHFDMVRPGTILYGQYPSRWVPRVLDLHDTWQLKSRISFVKTVPAGFSIGYGAEYVTRREARIAVIPIGWADGLTLTPESVARRSTLRLTASRLLRKPPLWVKVRGWLAPVVGRVAMQMCSIDVTGMPLVDVGDEVIIPSRRVTTSPALPRVYVDQDEVVADS
jgi:alanine racemase